MENYKKKYEQAFEKAKEVYNHKDATDSGKLILESMFPELKESVDERIRKEIISFLKEGKPYHCPNSVRRQEWATWLEKQGERKQNVVDIISDLENYFATTTKEQQEKDWDEIKNWEEKHFNHDRYIEITHTNKVKPKFKVGDWITIKE